jgi:hypothetical protein
MSTTVITCVALTTLMSLLLLFILSRLPVLVSPTGVAFCLPGAPWVPASVLLLALLLLLQLVPQVATYLASYFGVGENFLFLLLFAMAI